VGRLNKPEIPGYKYRSPGQTNAKDLMPNLREDVHESQKADAERIRRGLDTAETRSQNRKQVQEAGGRATVRSAGRAGLAGLAGEVGYGLGREIDERTGVGKEFVNKSGLGDAAEKLAAPKDRVKLSSEAEARIKAGELEEKVSPKLEKKVFAKPIRQAVDSISPEGKLRPGRNEDIDDETRERAGGYKDGGSVKKYASGGYVKSADGIAQRGKTKGRMC